MWRVTLFLMLGLGCSSPIWADDARSSCSQLAIGIGQFEKVRTVCDTQGIDAGIWQAQLKSLQCSQVLGDDVLTQIINTANNDAGDVAAAKGRTQFCEQEGSQWLQQLTSPLEHPNMHKKAACKCLQAAFDMDWGLTEHFETVSASDKGFRLCGLFD